MGRWANHCSDQEHLVCMQGLLYLLPLLAGVFVCVQSNINGHWQTKIGIQSAVIINGWVVAILSTILYLTTNQHSARNVVAELKPGIFLNGFFGFSVVTIAAFTFPKLGAASVMVVMVMGQVLTGLLLDHFGFLNLPQRDISVYRLIGFLLVALGVIFTTRG